MASDREAVKVLAEEMVKAVRAVVKDNNKSYVNNQIRNYTGGNASGYGGTINASQVKGLYGAVGGFIANASSKSEQGDQIASSIVSAVSSLASLEVKSIAADTAQIGDLYASFGEFLNLIVQDAQIGSLDVEQIRADIATLGIADIGKARISSAQIDVVDAATAFIREGVGGKYYIDNLAVTEGNIYALSVGKLMLKDDNGQMCQLVIDPTTEQVVATPVTFDGDVLIEEGTVTTEVLDDLAVTTEKIANNAVSGDKIIAGSILTKHLDASSIFAKDATIMDLIASNIKVSQLFANTGVVGDLTTSVIHSADFGNVLDISSNASITLANNYIGLMIETQDSTPTKLVLTDRMISAMADNIDVVAGDYITLRVADVLENEILSQDTAPEDPEEGLIWVDTSKVPNIVRKWNGSSWVVIDGSTLDGNSILINKLIQNMSSRISQTNDEILLQVTREDNAVIEGQVETINTHISKIEQRADQISMLVASQPTTYVQVGTPVIKANGDVWRNPNVEDYFVAEIIGDAEGIEFAYDDDGNLCYRYADGVDEKYEFSIIDDDLVIGADSEEDLGVDYQYVDGKLGSWKTIKNTAFSRLDQTVEGISTVVYDEETGLSAVSQKANKIDWIIQSGTSSSNMTMTTDALRYVANNLNVNGTQYAQLVVSVNGLVSTVGDEDSGLVSTVNQSADELSWIVQSGTSSANIKLTSGVLSSIADDIDLTANDTIRITSANQISMEAQNDLYLYANDSIRGVANEISLETMDTVIRVDSEGLHVGDVNKNSEVLIDDSSVNIVMNGQKYSQFGSNYVQFGNYQLRRTADGGLAFKLKE